MWAVKLPVTATFDVRCELDALDSEGAVELAWDRLERVLPAFVKALADEGFRLAPRLSARTPGRDILLDSRNGTMEEAEPA